MLPVMVQEVDDRVALDRRRRRTAARQEERDGGQSAGRPAPAPLSRGASSGPRPWSVVGRGPHARRLRDGERPTLAAWGPGAPSRSATMQPPTSSQNSTASDGGRSSRPPFRPRRSSATPSTATPLPPPSQRRRSSPTDSRVPRRPTPTPRGSNSSSAAQMCLLRKPNSQISSTRDRSDMQLTCRALSP
ncbi:hypothetical protein Cus16_1304 [Curtobacterium sp. ER1/6]|nr:hypothetical protein Cus16_1304 [Curtobacterium sp. ER1/6]